MVLHWSYLEATWAWDMNSTSILSSMDWPAGLLILCELIMKRKNVEFSDAGTETPKNTTRGGCGEVSWGVVAKHESF